MDTVRTPVERRCRYSDTEPSSVCLYCAGTVWHCGREWHLMFVIGWKLASAAGEADFLRLPREALAELVRSDELRCGARRR